MKNVVVTACLVAAVVLPACKKSEADTKASPTASSSAQAASAGASTAAAAAADVPCKDDSNKRVEDGKVTSCVLTKPYTTVDGYTCDADKIMYLYPNGKLKSGYLATPKEVNGFSCQDALDLTKDGKLRRCKVTQDKMVGDIPVKAGNWVTVYESGAVKRLEIGSGSTKIQGLSCKGYFNYFHENGKLKKCELAEDATLDGKKIAAKGPKGESVHVCFDDKGKRLADCKLLTGALD
jgi:hypothetical protein